MSSPPKVFDMLRRSVLAGEVKALIVVAAPRILGQLRKRYHGEVRSRIRAEIAKEVAGRPHGIATVVVNGRSPDARLSHPGRTRAKTKTRRALGAVIALSTARNSSNSRNGLASVTSWWSAPCGNSA